MNKILTHIHTYIHTHFGECLGPNDVLSKKGKGTRDQIANIHWIIEKAREFQKNIYFCFIDYTRDFDSVITTNWNILQDMGITDHLTCLLRNLYIGWLRSNS